MKRFMKRFAAILVCCAALGAQVAKEANSRYKTPEGREGVAKTLAGPDREQRQKPRELVEAMGIKPGMSVADIGTGVGYMLPFLSQAVGSEGRVFAEDIFDDFLAKAKQRAADEKLGNVTFVKGTERDPMLPAGGMDIVLALDSFHHYDYPAEMLAGIHRAIKPGGRFVLVEYYRRKEAMPGQNAMQHIRLDKADVIKEITGNHFRYVSDHDHVKGSQYMVIFERE